MPVRKVAVTQTIHNIVRSPKTGLYLLVLSSPVDVCYDDLWCVFMMWCDIFMIYDVMWYFYDVFYDLLWYLWFVLWYIIYFYDVSLDISYIFMMCFDIFMMWCDLMIYDVMWYFYDMIYDVFYDLLWYLWCVMRYIIYIYDLFYDLWCILWSFIIFMMWCVSSYI